jgi:hypothetical protein
MTEFFSNRGELFLLVILEQSEDGRPFNRGAIKNIAYRVAKQILECTHTISYKDCLYVFQDIDVLPKSEQCIYAIPNQNTVYNPYGVTHCLAKISMTSAHVIESTNGFPNNYWAWGLEDVCYQARIDAHGFHTDRTQFQWLGSDDWWTEQADEEPSKAFPKGDFRDVKAAYDFESIHRHTIWENGVSNVKYTVLNTSIRSAHVIEVIVHIETENENTQK